MISDRKLIFFILSYDGQKSKTKTAFSAVFFTISGFTNARLYATIRVKKQTGDETVQFFKSYTSNTLAGSGNQSFFTADPQKAQKGRVLYRVFAGGTHRYAFLFSNTVDSTFADGSHSHAGLVLDEWRIESLTVGRVKSLPALAFTDGAEADFPVEDRQPVTFGGKMKKTVMPGELFASDGVSMTFAEGEYLCLEMTFAGAQLPYHEESLLPVYKADGGVWRYDRRMPLPSMVGCDRCVKTRVAFWGDSITQGIGTPKNSYRHWNALVADLCGKDNAYWNLGLGYARARDAASDGAWAFKARQNDIAVVCFGVNDLLHEAIEPARLTAYLASTVRFLKKAGAKVILQTVPPFDYDAATAAVWREVNDRIRGKLSAEADAVFDTVPIFSADGNGPAARCGGHPDEAGCEVWAKELTKTIRLFL